MFCFLMVAVEMEEKGVISGGKDDLSVLYILNIQNKKSVFQD